MTFFSFNPLQLRPRRFSHESQDIILAAPDRGEHTISSSKSKSDVPRSVNGHGSGSKSQGVSKKRHSSRSREISWRLTSGFMGFFFLLAAAVQHNDPDPYLWIPAYMIPCVLSWVVTLAYAQLVELDEAKTLGQKTDKGLASNQPVLTSRSITQWLLCKLDTVILLHVLYCFLLGVWTLFNCFLDHESTSAEMQDEEAKELLGLCIVIAWLCLLKNGNFIHLGRLGLALGAGLTLTPFISWILVGIWEQEMPSCGN